ncbi:MAG: hypothetical protein IME99_00780 [Proteobacteria bacterium]|nr:hypothetical protein [Pseudomonadota bacterium]
MRYLGKKTIAALAVAFLLALPSFVLADSSTYRFVLGSVSRDLGRTLIVNESTRLKVTRDTKVYNSRGREISANTLRGHKWIYAEGPVNEDSSITAESIYLLPGYINDKAKGRYPFIKKH